MPYPPDDSAVSSKRPLPSNAPTFYAKRRAPTSRTQLFREIFAYELPFHDYAPRLNAQTLRSLSFFIRLFDIEAEIETISKMIYLQYLLQIAAGLGILNVWLLRFNRGTEYRGWHGIEHE
jgi:hypothetical protein